jgi:uncharacterized delta-60 repeat protein
MAFQIATPFSDPFMNHHFLAPWVNRRLHIVVGIVLAGALTAATARAQAPARIYQFNNSYADANGGSPMVPNGGTLGATGYTFAAGQGPNVSNALANTGEYSIEMVFRFDAVTSYRSILNFNGLTADQAFYCNSGSVQFYSYSTGNSTSADLVAGQNHRVIITRNAATKVTTAYVNGVQRSQVTDTSNYYVASSTGGILHFFRDNGGENSSGFVDQIRIYDTVLTPAQVAALGDANMAPQVPEINVRGNGATIADGDQSPSPADHTDFGLVNTSLARTFTIENTGAAALTISSIAVTGVNAGEFVVSGAPASVAAGASAPFTVTFTPGAGPASRSAIVTINSNDADEAAYDFALAATAPSLPTVVSVFPAGGPTNGGTAVTLTGTGFTGATNVTFGGVPATNVIVVSATQLTCTTPAGTAGVKSVLVTTPIGTSAANSLFTYEISTPGATESLNPGLVGSQVFTTLTQPDGKIIVGGVFSQILGTPRNNIARLNADGSLDSTFNPNANAAVVGLLLQPDGKIVISGGFTSVQPNGAPSPVDRGRIARLNSDGTLDTTFDPNANQNVSSMWLLPDGKILLAGIFTEFRPNGAPTATPRERLARIHPDGTLDESFSAGVNDTLNSVAVDPAGNILVAGSFSSVKSTGSSTSVPANRVARLDSSGMLDTSFNPNPNSQVTALIIQPDGKIVISGFFSALQPNGAPASTLRPWIARLLADGSLDPAFNPSLGYVPYGMAQQADGKLLVGIYFVAPFTVRLNPDGSADATFAPNPDNTVWGLELQPDGKLLIAGNFSNIGGSSRRCLARVYNDPATSVLTAPNSTRVVWNRGGSAPETSHVTFEQSTNGGGTWTPLGTPQRVAGTGNWELTGLSLPTTTRIRARGRTAVGRGNGSSGYLEQTFDFVNSPPTDIILTPPSIVENNSPNAVVGTLATSDANTGDFFTYSLAAGGADNGVFTLVGNTLRLTTVADFATQSSYSIRIRSTDAGGLSFEKNHTVQVLPPLPVVSSVSPEGGGTQGGTAITITGGNFRTPASVSIGGVNATSVTVVNATTITAVTQANVAGSFPVRVTTPGGVSTDETPFTYVTTPAITGISPATGTFAGGTTATLSGQGFTGVSSVRFGGVEATLVSVTPTAITVITPPHPAGVVDVELIAPLVSGTAENLYTYLIPPPGEVEPLNANIVGSIVLATAVQPDGKTLIAGNFTEVLGATRRHLVRINADGTLDAAFDPNPDGPVTSVVVAPGGDILLGGQFTSLQPNGAPSATPRKRLARIHADGTLDPGFDPNANGTVNCIVPQPDGRILIAGTFNSLQPNGAPAPVTRNRVARLEASGAVDTSFDPNANDEVKSLAIDAQGRVLLGGAFTTLQPSGAASAATRNHAARVNADGSLDATFDPNPNGAVHVVAVQADGRVLLGGAFTSPRNRLARVLDTGALDTAFAPDADTAVHTLALQADGRILFGGAFTSPRNRVARLNPDGTLDATFDPNPDNTVFSVALEADGRVLLGGFFNSLQPNGTGTPVDRDYFVRLANDTATQSLTTPDTARVLWTRGGSAPDFSSVAFESSTDGGSTWSPLFGVASRVGTTANWELTGTSFPPSGQLRALGRATGGYQGGGAGIIAQVAAYTAPVALPVVATVGPAKGSTLGGDTVTLTGTGFSGATAVSIGGNPAASFTVETPTTLTAITPPGVSGSASVTVTTPGGTSAPNSLFTFVTPPAVASVSPALGSTLGGNTVTITGSGFLNVTAVRIGGNPAAGFVVDHPGQITATTPPGVAGAANVVVEIDGATSADNPAFTYVAPPVVAGITPSRGSTLGGDSVTITGSGFSGATAVTLGGNPVAEFTLQNATTITSITPAGVAGTAGIVVTGPGGPSTANPLFTYVTPPAVTSVFPTSGTTVGGDSITISGSGFINVTAVRIGGIPVASYVVNHPTQITVVTPAGAAGTASVAVDVDGATTTANSLFIYVTPPTVASVSPALGTALGGNTITVTGTGFSGATAVTIGGNPAAFTVVNATTLTATTPPGDAGSASVRVTGPYGTSAANALFTYVMPPAIAGVSPVRGATTGGESVTITGSGFINVTAVRIGGIPVASFVVDLPTQITAVTPAGTAGTVGVEVDVAGASGSGNSLFTYLAAPTIASASPATGVIAGGDSVVLTGTNFSFATSVTFGGVAAASFTVDSPTQITATTPASTPGQKSVVVTTPGGSNAANSLFTFFVPATTTTLVSSQNPSVFLTQPTFTARAVSDQPGLTGEMSLFVDDVLVETKPVDANGEATFTPGPEVVGTGSRNVRVDFDGGDDFASSSATLTQVVGKAPLTIVLGSLSHQYNGAAKSATATTNVPEGYSVQVAITYNGSASAPVNAGTYAIAASIDDPNFSGSATGEMVITKAPLAFSVSPEPLVYNGNPRAPQLVFSPAGIPVSLTYQSIVNGVPTGASNSTAPTNAGSYLATVTTGSPNHQLTATSFEFDVLKANAALIFYNTDQFYNGTPRVPTVFVDPLGIPVTFTYQTIVNGVPTGPVSNQAPTAVGIYQVVPSSPNHQPNVTSAVLRVSKLPVSIGIKGLSASVDGQPKPVTVLTTPPGVPMTVTYTAGGTTTTTAPSAPPAGGGAWRVDVSPADPNSYTGSATGMLRIDTRVQPSMSLTGPAVTNASTPHAFTVTFGTTSRIKPTGNVYFRTLDNFGLFNAQIGADGRAIMTNSDYFLPVRATPYQVIAEYSGDANFLPASSNVFGMRKEKNTVVFAEYNLFQTYTARPAEIPRSGLAFLYYNPNFVSSYSFRHNGSSILPTNATTTPARIEVDYQTPYSTNYRDIINLTILKESARVRVGNLRQTWRPGGNPVQVTTDPAGLATQVTYNGVHLPNGPTTPGTYSVVATITDPNYNVYNLAEASGTLVVAQDVAGFNVTNLFQNYDGREKPVTVSASPLIPYVVTYNGSTRPPVAPGTYDVRVFPENTATYGSGSSHTLVIRARVSATVNGQANTANLRLRDGAGNTITSFPAFLSPNQNEWRLEFVNTDDLKFVRWSDGSRENPRRLSFGTGGDPAQFTYNAEAGQKFFLQAQTALASLPANSGGGATRSGYYAVGEMARFEAGTYGDAIINRWEYAGRTVTPADGHLVLRDGREVYIKVVANGGNPICHITPGFIAEGFANRGTDTSRGRVELRRKDFMGLPALGQRFMPNGVNYVATAKPQSGYLFHGWENSRNSQLVDPLKRLGFSPATTTEEFMRVGSERYSSVFPLFIKDGPSFSIEVSRHQRKVSASVSGVEIGGLRTANVSITNGGSATSGIRISRIQVTGFRLKRTKNSPWTYYYPFNRNAEEVRANQNSPMTNSEGALCILFQPVIVNNEALNFWDPDLFSNLVNSFADPMAVDYDVGSLNYSGSKDVSIVLGGLGQDVDFGPQSQAEVRFSFTLETNRGTQFVDAWWTDLNPTPAGLDPLSGW